ncbi:BPI fold-containing family A member 2 [Megaptera novaeangliae]
MFQLWKLVLLCSLLTGTSASLLEDLGNDVVSKLKPVLDKGLETVDSTLGPILQKLKADLEALQESTSWQEAQQKIQEAENLLDKALSKIFQVVEKVENQPLLGELVNLGLNLDLQTSVSIETDAKTGVSTVVVG